MTLLQAVLTRCGRRCGCEGACGRTHPTGTCTSSRDLTAAPYPARATDAQNANVQPGDLRPWCGPCWDHARGRACQDAAAARQQQMEKGQQSLFDLISGNAA
ncbi:hypothetical protein AB0K09_03550 [Streptomyces sp. NPDC049577]|uniref:hypothetical protein n=1 Tax=Streptomyces sp. NPDC049577 TaxID=3155153 RepID=UPI0034306ABD